MDTNETFFLACSVSGHANDVSQRAKLPRKKKKKKLVETSPHGAVNIQIAPFPFLFRCIKNKQLFSFPFFCEQKRRCNGYKTKLWFLIRFVIYWMTQNLYSRLYIFIKVGDLFKIYIYIYFIEYSYETIIIIFPSMAPRKNRFFRFK